MTSISMGAETKESGFTIVELLVALIVAAVLVGSVQLIYTNQTYLSERGRDLVLSNAYAEGKMESLRSKGFIGLNDGTTDITSELPSELSPPRSGNMVISTPNTGLKKVTITISYNAQGETKTETYTTFIGELGVGQY